MTKDPVCFADVDELEATTSGLSTDSNGRVYFFCSKECKERFEEDPSQFAESMHKWEESRSMYSDWPYE